MTQEKRPRLLTASIPTIITYPSIFAPVAASFSAARRQVLMRIKAHPLSSSLHLLNFSMISSISAMNGSLRHRATRKSRTLSLGSSRSLGVFPSMGLFLFALLSEFYSKAIFITPRAIANPISQKEPVTNQSNHDIFLFTFRSSSGGLFKSCCQPKQSHQGNPRASPIFFFTTRN